MSSSDCSSGQINWTLVQLTDRSGKTITVHCLNGLYFHHRQLPFPFNEQMERVRNMEVRSDDVIIFAYPKSGSHWVCAIVNMIQRFGSREPLSEELNQPEHLAFSNLNSIPSPRFFSSHARPQFAPQKCFSEAGKIILLERNPKAVVVSFYHMLTKVLVEATGEYYRYKGTWDDFLEMFLNGEVPWGSWFDYMIDWKKFMDKLPKSKYLQITYEGLSQDPVSTIQEIATFLEDTISRQRARIIAKECSFDNMKKTEECPVEPAARGYGKSSRRGYYRIGKVDDWKNWFTVAQEERFDAVYKQKFGN